jgi:hypothetical protein
MMLAGEILDDNVFCAWFGFRAGRLDKLVGDQQATLVVGGGAKEAEDNTRLFIGLCFLIFRKRDRRGKYPKLTQSWQTRRTK